MGKKRFFGVLKPLRWQKRKPQIEWPFAEMQIGDWFKVAVTDRPRSSVQQSMWQEAGRLGRGGAFRADEADGSGFTTIRCIGIAKERIERAERERLRVERWRSSTERQARRAVTIAINEHCRAAARKAAIAALLD